MSYKFKNSFVTFNMSPEVGAFSSTAQAGSLSIKDEKDVAVGLQNRRRLFGELNLDLEKAVFCQQSHSDNILVVTQKDAGAGSINFLSGVPDTDALITKERGVPLMVLVADCVPVLLYDPIGEIVGVVHAGWKGTMKQILRKTVEKMVSEYGSNSKDIIAVIGPSIGPDCFEIGQEVVDMANDAGLAEFVIGREGKFYFDLWASNKHQLLEEGVLGEKIKTVGVCNHCSPEYFSFRRDKNTNRFAVGIMLK